MPLTKQVLRVSETLKKETLEAHQSSENLLLPYLTSIQSLNDYARILKMFYGFFYPVEQLIFSQVTKETIHDIDERRKNLEVFFKNGTDDVTRISILKKYKPHYILIDHSSIKPTDDDMQFYRSSGMMVYKENDLELIRLND